MALIQCPDCSAQISDVAAACPHCGRPAAISKTTPETRAAEARRRSAWALTILGYVLVALGFIIFIGMAAEEPEGGSGMTLAGILLAVGLVLAIVGRIRKSISGAT